ncbi:MAG TPA: tRNA dimethylallyltransferase, partial [Pyrinomonadaceae bacterium]|nr:tRNA dimethylallyltransferase [Pyrinomonadaceae bacterium]
GRRFSALRDGLPSASEFSDRVKLFVLNPPRSELYQKINARSEAHFKAGLVEEVSLLLEKGLPAESSALGAHAYRRVVEYLQGKRTLESAIEKSKQDVRNYAKRQLTWFRRENVAKWLNGFGDDRLIFNEAYKEIEKLLSPTPLKLS